MAHTPSLGELFVTYEVFDPGENVIWDAQRTAQPTGVFSKAELFRKLQGEYGRCIGECGTHLDDTRECRQSGWIFSKTHRYLQGELHVEQTSVEVFTLTEAGLKPVLGPICGQFLE
ncbi:hypothetical protein [Azospirillum sp. SYSU D00513]|uniref:hypothetical protein n=1 Tax=Azospirillum sp. SYSU D00513 TaxID=2812561 RepID=UPI001A959D91|nr:hypothetical protein [Azospirillum sp. SYSU D00513]